MSRRRNHHYSRRHAPNTERSYHEYLLSTPAPVTTRTELMRMVRGGEDTYLELKVRFSNIEKLTAEIIALANTDGGALVFGVNDQLRVEGVDDPESIEAQLRELCTTQIQPPVFPYLNKVAFDNGRRIVVLEVESTLRPHRTLDDRFYLREGSSKREATREELSNLYGETHSTRFEQVPIFDARSSDIDESLFWSYVRGVNPGYWGEATKGFPTDYVMRDMGLAVKYREELVPTTSGLLLFGLNERLPQLLPRAEILLTRFSGASTNNHPSPAHAHPIVERVEFKGNVFRLGEGALSFIRRYTDLWDEKPSRRALQHENASATAVTARANYHRSVIIEAVTNLLVHRDWSASGNGQRSRINVYDDSIEFINPAQTPELPIISLRYGVTSAPNPRLKAILTNKHYGLPTVRGGIPMIFEESMNFARRAPEGPAIANHEFRLKIYGLH